MKSARCHRKIPKNQIQCISKHAINRLAGYPVSHVRMAKDVTDRVRSILRYHMKIVCRWALTYMVQTKTLMPLHLKAALDALHSTR